MFDTLKRFLFPSLYPADAIVILGTDNADMKQFVKDKMGVIVQSDGLPVKFCVDDKRVIYCKRKHFSVKSLKSLEIIVKDPIDIEYNNKYCFIVKTTQTLPFSKKSYETVIGTYICYVVQQNQLTMAWDIVPDNEIWTNLETAS